MKKSELEQIALFNSLQLLGKLLDEMREIRVNCLFDEVEIKQIRQLENWRNKSWLNKLDCVGNHIFNLKEDIKKVILDE